MNKDSITLFYNSQLPDDRQLVAQAVAMKLQVEPVDILATELAPSVTQRLSGKLRLPIASMVNRHHPYFRDYYKEELIGATQWQELLTRRPELLQTPIAEKDRLAFFVQTPDQLKKINNL